MDLITLAVAGSVTSVATVIAHRFTTLKGTEFTLHSGPAGLLADQIFDGLPTDIYISASTTGPERLHRAGLFGAPRVIAHNRMVLVAAPEIAVASDDALTLLADPRWRIAHSTPGADPSGDYATAFIDRLSAVEPSLSRDIRRRSACLFGAALPDPAQTANSPACAALRKGKADLFLVYATTAQRMTGEVAGSRVFPLPEYLSPKTDVCACLKQDPPEVAAQFFDFLQGQEAREMFDTAGWL